uniref:Ribosome biogenesis protein NOP53 n=1 Tax=Myripristis murdjan TaxID=586833 RepID=A0A667Y4A6_9TELE
IITLKTFTNILILSSSRWFNMAAARRLKRVVASQPGFLPVKTSVDAAGLTSGRRKRVNKNKKKSWGKHSDIQDVEQFLDDVRLQERTTGGLLSERPDDSLFFLDVGQEFGTVHQSSSVMCRLPSVLAHQKPNAKKLRRLAQRAERLAAKGVVPRKQRQLLNRRPVDKTAKKTATEANNNPDRGFYNLWGQEGECGLNALLLEAHEVEVKKQKEEEKIEKQLAFNKEETTIFQEQVEGLLEEEEKNPVEEEGQGEMPVGAIVLAEKKTEKQRKREKMDKIKAQQRQVDRQQIDRRQQLFQLRSIKASIKQQEQRTKERQTERKAKQEAQKAMPRRLGRLKYTPDLEVQLSDELASSLRQLKPEGSILKDRFKSLQKRNLIEPRERAKFKRRHKLKYVEKRAFREIT